MTKAFVIRYEETVKNAVFILKKWIPEFLLYLAAKNRNMHAFEVILNRSKIHRIVMEVQTHSGIYMTSEGISHFCEEKIEEYFEDPGPFITQKPEFLDKILEKNSNGSNTYIWNPPDGESEILVNGSDQVIYAPDFYVAILYGDVKLVHYLLMHRTQLCADDQLNELKHIKGERYLPSSHEEYTFEDRYYTGRKFLKHNYIFFSDPFTAAICAQDCEKIAMLGKMEKEIQWNHSMERAVAHSNQEVTEYLLRNFPEILDYINLSSIYEAGNLFLLKAFVKKYTDMTEHAAELECYFVWKDKARNPLINMLEKQERISTAGMLEFYKKLLKYVKTTDIVIGVRRDIIDMIPSIENEDVKERYRIFFHEIDEGFEEDCTDFFLCTDVICQLGKGVKKPFLSMNQYEIQYGDYMTVHNLMTVMRYIKPKELRAEKDKFTDAVLSHNSIKLVQMAIKKGYIGSRNALSLYERALENPKCDERILHVLMDLSESLFISEKE